MQTNEHPENTIGQWQKPQIHRLVSSTPCWEKPQLRKLDLLQKASSAVETELSGTTFGPIS